MQVSLEWLNEYVDLDGIEPELIAHKLTMSGLEVEEIEVRKQKFTNIITALIKKIDNHPNADKLHLVTVDTGNSVKTVVCGAQNIKEGQIISDGSNQEVFIQKRLSAKIKLTGKIINISIQEIVCIISVLCQNEIFQIVYDPIEAANFKVGEQVIIASKAFSPVLYKLEVSL